MNQKIMLINKWQTSYQIMFSWASWKCLITFQWILDWLPTWLETLAVKMQKQSGYGLLTLIVHLQTSPQSIFQLNGVIFFTKLLLSPTHFNWASNFVQSKAWDLFNCKYGSILFSIPNDCPTNPQIFCQKSSAPLTQDKKGKAVLEDLTPPPTPLSSKIETPGECSSVPKKKKVKQAEILVDSAVLRSLRVKKANRGFKASPCAGKNCLSCDSEPPVLSPTLIKNLGVEFCKIEEKKLS